MSTYTVTEDKALGWWSVLQDGTVIDMGFREDGARREARRLNLAHCGEAMLALLVESRDHAFGECSDFPKRRDALIEQINGEAQ